MVHNILLAYLPSVTFKL